MGDGRVLWYLKALALDPTHVGALFNLATLYRSSGDVARSIIFERRNRGQSRLSGKPVAEKCTLPPVSNRASAGCDGACRSRSVPRGNTR
ncbi:MAG: tetratricopeptide repeat protein [Rhodanobacter sp.]|jgi:hypothetical protein|uniref:tetratricopeptide repeat protein n=1 Tax=Rhodanobacter sp. KK11 TaxID=3083255 RepID=UPI00296763C3|nr:tetratricopeptide repeat protein [Rhodanobacter sp. KK11]MDW2980459.1 tetratricopeptide repeat protein [Rhodanobacter sp. KK11]